MQNNPISLITGHKHIGLIVSGWHAELLGYCETAFRAHLQNSGINPDQIVRIEAPGALEFPLLAQKMAETDNYCAIALIGLVVDGGIYRHDFVAQAVLNGIVRVSLDHGVPVLSAVLTPHNFQETEVHEKFFSEHLEIKGRELATAVVQIIKNIQQINSSLTATSQRLCQNQS